MNLRQRYKHWACKPKDCSSGRKYPLMFQQAASSRAHSPARCRCAGSGTRVRSPPAPGPRAPGREQEVNMRCRSTHPNENQCSSKVCKTERCTEISGLQQSQRFLTPVYICAHTILQVSQSRKPSLNIIFVPFELPSEITFILHPLVNPLSRDLILIV